jgi:hypothetical protein
VSVADHRVVHVIDAGLIDKLFALGSLEWRDAALADGTGSGLEALNHRVDIQVVGHRDEAIALPKARTGDRLHESPGTSQQREFHVKKGRHRRFEEARALKRSTEVAVERCPECGAGPDDDHASWCLAAEDDEYEGYEGQEAGQAPN